MINIRYINSSFVAAIAGIFLGGCGDSAEREPIAAAPAVTVYSVAAQPLQPVMVFNSKLGAFEEAHVVPRVSGRVLDRHAEGGERVKSGEVLLAIDPEPFELRVSSEQAALASASAVLIEAQSEYERGKSLIDEQMISRSRFDQLTAGLATARAEKDLADAALNKAELDLSYTRVTAPIDGLVDIINVSIGDMIGPEHGAAFTITSDKVILLDINVSEADNLRYVRRQVAGENISFDIRLQLADGELYGEQGKIFSTAAAANPATGTVKVRLAFDNPKGLLTPGMNVKALIRERSDDVSLAVPLDSIQQDQLGHYLLRIGEGELVEQVHIERGPVVDQWQIVTQGVQAGDRIITKGLQQARIGNPVTIK